MIWIKPTPSEVLKAIEAYFAIAYGGSTVPKSVQARIDSLNKASADKFYQLDVFEVDQSQPATKFALRLGNRCYPHMKLIIERTPIGDGYLFRADTHDQHVRPKPGTRDAELFTQLVIQNQEMAQQIEAAWENADLPTFKSYLRDDLARRIAAGRSGQQCKPETKN